MPGGRLSGGQAKIYLPLLTGRAPGAESALSGWAGQPKQFKNYIRAGWAAHFLSGLIYGVPRKQGFQPDVLSDRCDQSS